MEILSNLVVIAGFGSQARDKSGHTIRNIEVDFVRVSIHTNPDQYFRAMKLHCISS